MKSKILLKILMPFFFLLTAFTVVGQTLNVSSSSLTGVSTTYGTASSHVSFDVDGSSLTNDLVITVGNSAFEISSDGGATYGASVNLGSGNVASTNIRVRLKATAGVAGSPYLGVILNVSSTGATPASVDVSIASSTVAQKVITISGTSIASRVYNGTTAAGTITLGTVSGLVGTETLAITPSATAYSSANVGSAYSSTVSYAIADGTNGGVATNYSTLADDNLTNLAITPKALTITAPTIAPKVYNGSAAAGVITAGTLSGFVGTETVVATPSATAYSSANVGSAYSSTVSYVLADGTNGGLAANYSAPANDNLTNLSITAKTITISGTSIASRAYNGTTAAGTITLGTVSGLVGSETLAITPSATAYSSANVGSAYTSTVSYAIADGTNGGLAANYSTLADDNLTNLAITAKTITISGTSIAPKVYNASTAAGTITLGTVSGLVGTETLAITPSATAYSSANVGSAYSSTVSYAIADGTNGGLAANYSALANDNLTNLAITAKALTITAPSIAPKVYDGSAAAGVITAGTLSGFVGTETVVATPSATAYSSANVGSAYSSTVSYVLADGTNGGLAANYSAPANDNLTNLSITAKTITISGTSIASRAYNGTTAAGTITLGTVSGLVGSETLAITPSATAYSSANVGSAYVSTVSYAIADGTNGGLAANYSALANDNLTNLAITAKALTITAPSIAPKVYDGSAAAGVITAGTLSGFVGTETVVATPSATAYSSANVGSAYSSTVSYILADGTNGGLAANYSAPANDNLTNLSITAKALTITAPTIASKAYDGTTAAGAITVGTLSGFVGTETVTATPSATAYSSANVGSSYSSTVSYTLVDGTNGGLAANYTAPANDNLTGLAITPKALTITAPTIASKVYNGSTAAGTITLGTLSGLVGSETVVVTPSATAYSSANVGSAYTSTVSYAIADGTNGGVATNYTAPANNNLTGLSITPAAISITADNETKVYGTSLINAAGKTTFTISSGTLAGSETISSVSIMYGTGAAPNAPVGTTTGTVIPFDAVGANGFIATNYNITYVNGNITITPAPLTITANPVSKEHGSALAATVTGVTAFTATGLVNWELIGSVTMGYGNGRELNDAIGVYANQVTPSAATGGTFTASNYTITYVPADLTVVVSTNAFLSDLVASTGPLNTAFNKFDLDYDTYVLTAVDQFTITPTLENQFATIQARIDNTGFGPGAYVPLTSGVASAPFSIREGDNIIEILVTAEDGVTQLNYRILYRRESSFVSGGGGGGLESKSLGDAIAQRVLNNAINDMNGAVDYNKLPVVETAQGTIRSTSTNSIFGLQLASIMPDLSSRGYKAYNSSPVDIVSFTNAKEVFAVDYVNTNKETKAVAFTTKTLGELYDHTKPICDRLKGATLLDVESVKIDGYDFINYTIRNDKGNLEYATAFTVGAKAGRNSFNLQSAFLTTSYINEDQMYNFQIWAASPNIVNDMVKEVLAKLKDVAPVSQSIVSASPDTYIESGKREGANLKLVIKNGTAATTGFFKFEDRSNESSTGIVTRNVPFTVNANGTSTITVPVGDKYESSISMSLNGEVKDMLYMSDGTWAIDYNRNTTSVSAFTVSNDAKRVISANEYPVLRNVEVKANSSDFVSLFKLLKAGGMEADLSGYAGLKFTASGGYNLRVTMVQNGISEWKNQYTTDIRLGSGQQEYFIPFSQFKSAASTKNIDPKDVTTLVFTVEVNAGRNSPIASTFSNISFTKEKPVINTTEQEEKTIQVFPNPVTDNVFTASFVSPVAGELTMKINDGTGRSIFTKQVNVVKGPNAVPVRLNNGVIGTHFLTLEGKGVKFAPTTVVIVK